MSNCPILHLTDHVMLGRPAGGAWQEVLHKYNTSTNITNTYPPSGLKLGTRHLTDDNHCELNNMSVLAERRLACAYTNM